jgi:FMN phosphatase YigB (HAD superfamily)
LDNTLIKSPYSYIFDDIVLDISTNTKENPNLIWLQINREFRTREEKNLISAFDWDDILFQVCKKLGSKWEGSIRDCVQRHVSKHGVKVFDGVKDSLKALRSTGAMLECTTNGHFLYQEPLLRAAGLQSLFDDFITSDCVGCTKSSELFYREKTEKDTAVVIGDSYKYDVLYPMKFGLYAIWDVETVLLSSMMRKYLESRPSHRPVEMKDELVRYFKDAAINIYSQHCEFTKTPDAIVFNFPEVLLPGTLILPSKNRIR